MFKGLAFQHPTGRAAIVLPYGIYSSMQSTQEKIPSTPGLSPPGQTQVPLPRGPNKSFVPCYPHQHQAGKLCLDKPTLIFMIGRRLRARLEGPFSCVCKVAWRALLHQCRAKTGCPSHQGRGIPAENSPGMPGSSQRAWRQEATRAALIGQSVATLASPGLGMAQRLPSLGLSKNNVQVSPPPIRVLCACGVTRSSRLLTPLKRVATERPLHAEAVHRRLGEGRCSSISIGEASRGRACSRACCHHQLLACRGRSRG